MEVAVPLRFGRLKKRQSSTRDLSWIRNRSFPTTFWVRETSADLRKLPEGMRKMPAAGRHRDREDCKVKKRIRHRLERILPIVPAYFSKSFEKISIGIFLLLAFLRKGGIDTLGGKDVTAVWSS